MQKARMKEVLDLTRHGIHENVIVAALNRDRTIREIGFNEPKDLILDNFGQWLAAFIRQPTVAEATVSLNDIVPSAQTFYVWWLSHDSFNITARGNVGTQIQLGKGDTTPARANTNIEIPFTLPPLNTRFATGPGSYASGAISFSGSVTAAEADTVKESGLFAVWVNSASALKTIMLFHDVISPTVDFIIGNTVTCSYSISL